MKLPATSSNRFSMIRKPHGGSPRSVIHCDSVCGICSVVSTNANRYALPMMNISIAVTFAASAITRGTSRKPHVAVDEHGDHERVDRGHRGGLGRREHAADRCRPG